MLPMVLGVVAAVSVLVCAAHGAPVLGTGVLYLVPAILLVLPLIARRYVGEERLAGLARRMARRARPTVPRSAPRVRLLPAVRMVRGGRLVGAGLSVRGPPARA